MGIDKQQRIQIHKLMNALVYAMELLYSHEGPIMVFDGTILMTTK
jgi:hypothetical protein